MLFASAPLPFVKDMVSMALDSSWTEVEKELVLSAIDYDRVTSNDQEYLGRHHQQLPQQAYLYRALWRRSQHKVKHPAATVSQSPPWVIACCKDHYGEQQTVQAGPIKLHPRSMRQGVFFSTTPAYGILYRLGRPQGVVQPGLPFDFLASNVLVVFEAQNAVILRSVNHKS